MDEDFIVDDILENNKKVAKKKVDGKSKGDRTELHLAKLLSEHFGVDFSRALGSGSRTKQVKLSKNATDALGGDICVPDGFRWVIECKGGYEKEMDGWSTVDGKLTQLDAFIEQVSEDARICKRKPLLLWKRNRKPWLAFIQKFELHELCLENVFLCKIQYNGWLCIPFELLLEKTNKDFWFEAVVKA